MKPRKGPIGYVLALALAALIGAAASATSAIGRPAYSDDGAPSTIIFPLQSLPLTFSHAKHLGRAPDLQCVDCHDSAQDSKSAVDLLTPGEDACTMCHPID